jgi:CRP-like cAMP-binding protein
MITVQKILFLRNVPLFSGMQPDALSQLAGIAEEIVYSQSDPIIVEGDHGEAMFLIVEGKVRIHRNNVTLAALGSEDYFGEMSILDGEPRSASATAESDCLLLRISQSDFQRILSGHFNVAITIIQTLTRRLRQMAEESAARAPDIDHGVEPENESDA